LLNSITNAVIYIDAGRKGFATRGKEQEGRIFYETGIATAMTAFQQASNQRFATSADTHALILAEYTFITQELQLCDKADKDTINSLTQAIGSFDDAFLALKVVENKNKYEGVENTYPHNGKYRFCGFPKDAFHIACIAHKTRLQNILRSPGIDLLEKALLKQRFVNLSAGQGWYVEKQKKALIND
jgi:hypothetical protein